MVRTCPTLPPFFCVIRLLNLFFCWISRVHWHDYCLPFFQIPWNELKWSTRRWMYDVMLHLWCYYVICILPMLWNLWLLLCTSIELLLLYADNQMTTFGFLQMTQKLFRHRIKCLWGSSIIPSPAGTKPAEPKKSWFASGTTQVPELSQIGNCTKTLTKAWVGRLVGLVSLHLDAGGGNRLGMRNEEFSAIKALLEMKLASKVESRVKKRLLLLITCGVVITAHFGTPFLTRALTPVLTPVKRLKTHSFTFPLLIFFLAWSIFYWTLSSMPFQSNGRSQISISQVFTGVMTFLKLKERYVQCTFFFWRRLLRFEEQKKRNLYINKYYLGAR